MDPARIPDDVIFEILAHVHSAADLAALALIGRPFALAARRPILRALRWTRPGPVEHTLEMWRDVYEPLGMESLPKSVTVGILFELSEKRGVAAWRPQKPLHDAIHAQIARFTGLTTLVFARTVISTRYTYGVLAHLPELRSLSIIDCDFIYLPDDSQPNPPGASKVNLNTTSDPASASTQPPPPPGLSAPPFFFAFAALPITHLALSNIKITTETMTRHPLHPINLLRAEGLRSIELAWTRRIANAWAAHILAPMYHPRAGPGPVAGPLLSVPSFIADAEDDAAPPTPARPAFGALTHVTASLPAPTHDLVESLAGLLASCPLAPTVHLRLERAHEDEFRSGGGDPPGFGFGRGASLLGALRGVTRYEGPVEVVGCVLPQAVAGGGGGGGGVNSGGLLTHVRLAPLDLDRLLRRLERLPRLGAAPSSFPSSSSVASSSASSSIENDLGQNTANITEEVGSGMRVLELGMLRWDVEVLFAICALFGRSVERVVIRYGTSGGRDEEDKEAGKAKENGEDTQNKQGNTNSKGKEKEKAKENTDETDNSIAHDTFLPILGADILAYLPRLRSLILIHDPAIRPAHAPRSSPPGMEAEDLYFDEDQSLCSFHVATHDLGPLLVRNGTRGGGAAGLWTWDGAVEATRDDGGLDRWEQVEWFYERAEAMYNAEVRRRADEDAQAASGSGAGGAGGSSVPSHHSRAPRPLAALPPRRAIRHPFIIDENTMPDPYDAASEEFYARWTAEQLVRMRARADGRASAAASGSGGEAASVSNPEQTDLRDYLYGWSRFCPALREVQIGEARWVRRWEGDEWAEEKAQK